MFTRAARAAAAAPRSYAPILCTVWRRAISAISSLCPPARLCPPHHRSREKAYPESHIFSISRKKNKRIRIIYMSNTVNAAAYKTMVCVCLDTHHYKMLFNSPQISEVLRKSIIRFFFSFINSSGSKQ